MPVEKEGGGRKLEGLGLWRYGRWMRRFCVDGRLTGLSRMAAHRYVQKVAKRGPQEEKEEEAVRDHDC